MDAGKQGSFQTGQHGDVEGGGKDMGFAAGGARVSGSDAGMNGTAFQTGQNEDVRGTDTTDMKLKMVGDMAMSSYGANLGQNATNTIGGISGFTQSDGLDDDEPSAPNL